MKNKKNKPVSSYLLMLLGIIAVLACGIILYLSYDRNNREEAQGFFGSNTEALEKEGFTSDVSYASDSDEDSQLFYGPSFDESYNSDSSNSNNFESDNSASNDSDATDTRESAGPMPSDSSKASDPGESSETEANSQGTISPSHGSSAFANNSDETLHTLLSQIKGQLPVSNGSWSVYVCDLSTGTQGTINESQMQAASLIKLYIMGAVYENYETLSQQYGTDTLNTNLSSMITVSDNDAANTLVSFLGNGDSSTGMSRINTFCQEHGYTSTSMGRLLLASKEYGDNYTSVADCGKFLKEIYEICNGTSQSSGLSHAEDMYALLKQQQRTNKIPAALPAGVQVANKTGELSDVENDAGILYNTALGNDLVICFMSENLNDTQAAQNTIAQLSSIIYSSYNK